ncbi:sulfotransferase [Sphingorhabdus sp. IMCC26285]|uniref:Sulfotransferase n=1 Tax=Sphingorhabdus profundilacus TaxID=2509718 RepID=A0A6I4LU78_9SPHN|nr:sulfotransferase [Sphingorhabdus profundilacus]MVZ96571.1 sulfotransferase [Sphingorhabdus profundilacus]
MTNLQSIIYISGSGRSGSTLLERIIHSSDCVSALGEFHCLWRLPETDITCSCAAPFISDSFWQPVLKTAAIDASVLAELRELEDRVCRTSFIASHRFDIKSLRENRDVQHFLDIQFRIFEAVAGASGSSVLVDSSKAGPRAWLMACHPKVRIIHLYRDPADVILSWRSAKFDPGMGQEMKRMSVAAAATDWWKVEYLVKRLGKATPVARVDYGELCARPERTLGNALAALSLPTKPAPAWIDATSVKSKDNYHSLNGNPDRFDKGPIRISKREADWNKVGPAERLTIIAVAKVLGLMLPSSPSS